MKVPMRESIEIKPEICGYKRFDEPLLPGEIPFSAAYLKDKLDIEDIHQLRAWKNIVVDLRDKNKETYLFPIFDNEVKRIVEFLNKLLG